MSKRLQVLLDEPEWRDVQRAARAQRLTVAEWVRQALRAARRTEPLCDTDKKLAVVRAAAQHAFPTADIDQMLAEIQRGALGQLAEVVFIDSNVPMYLVGAEHPHKAARGGCSIASSRNASVW